MSALCEQCEEHSTNIWGKGEIDGERKRERGEGEECMRETMLLVQPQMSAPKSVQEIELNLRLKMKEEPEGGGLVMSVNSPSTESIKFQCNHETKSQGV